MSIDGRVAGKWFMSVVGAVLVAGCVDVPQRPAEEPQIQAGVAQTITISRDQRVRVSGFSRVLRGGTQWRYVGSLPEGAVYRPVDTVFTVQAFQSIHEAYLVLQDGKIAGYYLPAVRSISVSGSPVPIDVTSP